MQRAMDQLSSDQALIETLVRSFEHQGLPYLPFVKLLWLSESDKAL